MCGLHTCTISQYSTRDQTYGWLSELQPQSWFLFLSYILCSFTLGFTLADILYSLRKLAWHQCNYTFRLSFGLVYTLCFMQKNLKFYKVKYIIFKMMVKFSVLCRKAYSPLDHLNRAPCFWAYHLFAPWSLWNFFLPLPYLVVVAFLSDLQMPCTKNKWCSWFPYINRYPHNSQRSTRWLWKESYFCPPSPAPRQRPAN